MPRLSLKLRLILLTILFISLGFIGTAFFLINIFNQYVQSQVKQELLIHLNQLTASFSLDEMNRLMLDKPLSDPRFNNPYSGLYWQINTLKDEHQQDEHIQDEHIPDDVSGLKEPLLDSAMLLLRSRSLWEEILILDKSVYAATEDFYIKAAGPPDESLLVLGRVISLEDNVSDRFLLSVAINEAIPLASFNTFKQILYVAFMTLTFGMMLIAWLIIHLSLKPLNHIKTRLNDITQGKTRRLLGNYPKEIQPLVDSFNDVLDHDTEVLTRARTQAGNLAHSLKTPLTILSQAAQNYYRMNHTPQVSLKQRLSNDVLMTEAEANREDTLPHLIETQVKSIKQFIDYHLAQTRAAASASIPGQMTQVKAVLTPLIKTLGVLYQHKNIQFITLFPSEPEDKLYFQGEKHDLYEILGNVLDNACKWARQSVHITVFTKNQTIVFWIEDDGIGLDATLRESVLQRGVRVDEHTQGSGIGLFIVQDLCKLYRGTLALDISHLGGLKVILTLPSPKKIINEISNQ